MIFLKKSIALVAQGNKKADLIELCDFNKGTLGFHDLCATVGTGTKSLKKQA